MRIEQKLILDQDDICNLVAQEYKVPENQVHLKIDTVSVGYGMDEHLESIAKVEISFRSPQEIVNLIEKIEGGQTNEGHN